MQLLKALLPILVTLLGIVTLGRCSQKPKAASSIIVTVLGIVTLSKSLLQNLYSAIFLVPIGISILTNVPSIIDLTVSISAKL